MRTDNLPFAVAVILFTVLALSLGDALIKLSSGNFAIWQVFVIRSAVAIPCLASFMLWRARASLVTPSSIKWVIVRSLLLVSMWFFYYLSLPHLSLSVAAAAYYTLPIFITLFSAVFAGEAVSRKGWLAVALGFVGVLMALKPTTTDFNWYALLPLLSAILYAFAMILTRTKCIATHPLMLSLALNVAFVVIGGMAAIYVSTIPDGLRHGFIFSPWVEMGLSEWLSMSLLAAALLIGSVGTAFAYQNGPSAVISIFDFAYVGFSVVWSMVFFSDSPDAMTMVGVITIVAAGVVSLRQ